MVNTVIDSNIDLPQSSNDDLQIPSTNEHFQIILSEEALETVNLAFHYGLSIEEILHFIQAYQYLALGEVKKAKKVFPCKKKFLKDFDFIMNFRVALSISLRLNKVLIENEVKLLGCDNPFLF